MRTVRHCYTEMLVRTVRHMLHGDVSENIKTLLHGDVRENSKHKHIIPKLTHGDYHTYTVGARLLHPMK